MYPKVRRGGRVDGEVESREYDYVMMFVYVCERERKGVCGQRGY